MRVWAALLACLVLAGCAMGNRDWRRASYRTTVELRDAGDGRCSDPAPYTSLRACLIHDAPYQLARDYRCKQLGSPEQTSEQARLIADYQLAAQMAYDGYPEWQVRAYFEAVRLGGWVSWHYGGCE